MKIETKEIQASLKALCQKMMLGFSADDLDRYENYLKELYLRGEEPEMTLNVKK